MVSSTFCLLMPRAPPKESQLLYIPPIMGIVSIRHSSRADAPYAVVKPTF